jgi:hypothetical protein
MSPAPKITGTLSKKLKRAAAGRSSPRNTPPAMVAPERLSPGAIASAW